MQWPRKYPILFYAIHTRTSLGYQYSEFINGVKVRTSDGIHITKNGADNVIKDLINDK